MVSWRQIIDGIRLGRPLFLAGGFVFHGLGVAIALYQGVELNIAAVVWGQIAISAIQWMTHYSNDYFDLAADRVNSATSRWSGGSRVLVEGRLPPRLALTAAVALGLIALVATLVAGLFGQTSWGTMPLLLLSLVLAWEYSAPPLRLHWRGLGTVTVVVLVPILTPLVGYYLQAGRLTGLHLLASCPLALLQAAMIFIIDLSDAAGDRQVGKRTLVVRLGEARAARVYLALLASAYGLLPLLVAWGLPGAVAVAALFPLPLAGWLAWQMAGGAWRRPARWDGLGLASVSLLMSTALLEMVAFFW